MVEPTLLRPLVSGSRLPLRPPMTCLSTDSPAVHLAMVTLSAHAEHLAAPATPVLPQTPRNSPSLTGVQNWTGVGIERESVRRRLPPPDTGGPGPQARVPSFHLPPLLQTLPLIRATSWPLSSPLHNLQVSPSGSPSTKAPLARPAGSSTPPNFDHPDPAAIWTRLDPSDRSPRIPVAVYRRSPVGQFTALEQPRTLAGDRLSSRHRRGHS